MRTKHIIVSAAFLTLSSVAFAQTQIQKELNDFILSASSLETRSALTKTPYTPDQLPQVVVNDAGEAFELRKRDIDVKATPGPDMFATDATTIFPGAVVFADTDLADGRPTLVGLPAGTADIFVEFNTGSTVPSEQITLTSKEVSNYIYRVLRDANNLYAPPVNLNVQTKYCSSTSEVAYAIGCDAKYLTNKVKVDTKTTKNETKIISVQDFTQKYFTVSVTPHSSKELYKYFGNVTKAEFSNRVGNRAIAVINSVTYGRRAYAFQSYSTSDMTFTGTESAKVNAGGVSVNASSAQNIAKRSKTDDNFVFILGGSIKPAQKVLKGTPIREAFSESEEDLKIGPSNQGVPIAFTARFLATGRQATAMATGKTTEVSYVKMPKRVDWEVKNNADVAGKCVKFKDMYNVAVVKFNSAKNEYYIAKIHQGSGNYGDSRYVGYNEIQYGSKGSTSRRHAPEESDMKKIGVNMDEAYIYGPVFYTVRSRTAEGQNWSESDQGYFDVSSCNGSARIVIEGSALAGSKRKPYVHSSSNPKPIH